MRANPMNATGPFRWIAGLALLLAGGFAVAGAGGTNVLEDSKPPCCRVLQPGAVFGARSLYQLESEWTSDVGRRLRLGVLAGRPQVVALFFTHCRYACPMIVKDMRRIEAALPDSVRPRVDFLLITLDPERDLPAVLQEYRRAQGLPVAHWSLLQGGAEDVREIAVLLGVNYRREADGQFAHSNLITLLNSKGEITHQMTGLNQDVAPFVRAVVDLEHP